MATSACPVVGVTFWRQLLKALPVIVATLALRWYVEQLPVGEHFRNFEYAILQGALSSEVAAARPLYDSGRYIVPVVIDISHVPFDRSLPTDRKLIAELIDTLEDMNAAAIGIDIDFSPDDEGRFITTQDPQFFQTWADNARHNIRLGVYRREGDSHSHWLGHEAFRGLAAGIMLPESDAAYAYQFSSPDLAPAHDFDSPDGYVGRPNDSRLKPDDYLLQMPAALYAITHQRPRDRIVEDPHVKQQVMEKRILVGRYPIDFSLREHIQPIPYRYKGDLDRWAEQIEGRAVLVGDLRDTEDSRSIPGFDKPLSGVLIHASALATLNKGLLLYIDGKTSLALEVVLLLFVVAAMTGLQCAKNRIPSLRRMNAEAMEVVTSVGAAVVVLALSITLIGVTHFFWPDFLWIAAGFLFHPYIHSIGTVFLKGAKGFLAAART